MWEYEENKEKEEMQLWIPLAEETTKFIEHCGVNVAHKTLRIMTCSSGSQEEAILQLKEKVQGWITQATSAKMA